METFSLCLKLNNHDSWGGSLYCGSNAEANVSYFYIYTIEQSRALRLEVFVKQNKLLIIRDHFWEHHQEEIVLFICYGTVTRC